jgi:hypothetical protein
MPRARAYINRIRVKSLSSGIECGDLLYGRDTCFPIESTRGETANWKERIHEWLVEEKRNSPSHGESPEGAKLNQPRASGAAIAAERRPGNPAQFGCFRYLVDCRSMSCFSVGFVRFNPQPTKLIYKPISPFTFLVGPLTFLFGPFTFLNRRFTLKCGKFLTGGKHFPISIRPSQPTFLATFKRADP